MKVVQRLFLIGLVAICLLSAVPAMAQSSCGDANGDAKINVGDAVYIINYVFRGGPAPLPSCCYECTSGQTRPCYTGPSGSEDVGECHGGIQTCVDGTWGPCEGEVLPSAEVCDGQDNDCNGIDDDDVPGVGEYCNTGLQGVCAAGIRYCVAGIWWCEPIESASAEVCDGLDNDCNGMNDDISSPPPCSMQDGVCSGSVMRCDGPAGWQECTPADYGPHYETIEATCDDGLDNDCDGVTDADDPDCQKKQ